MRAIILILSAICFLSIHVIAQKKDSVKYERFAKVKLQDLQLLVSGIQEYKRLIMYDPTIPDDKKPVAFRNIESALIEIQKRVSIDSTKVNK